MHDLDFENLDHEKFMRAALAEAARALAEGERPIGAVIVYKETVIARGRAQHQSRNSEIAHAELNALLDAERFLADHTHEVVIYSTVEPCVMCLGAIVMSDIDHVVFALADRWIHPEQMLEIAYVRRHIKNYLGGVLEAESVDLWKRGDPEELALLLGEPMDE